MVTKRKQEVNRCFRCGVAGRAGRREKRRMTTPSRMEEEPSHMAEKILQLTLEIICLLTGETSPPVLRNHVTIKVRPLRSLMLYCDAQQKILEVTNKITELLSRSLSKSQDLMMLIKVKEEAEDASKSNDDLSLGDEIDLEIFKEPGDSMAKTKEKSVDMEGRSVKEEDGPVEIGTDGKYLNNIKKLSSISPDCVQEYNDITVESTNPHLLLHDTDSVCDPSPCEEHFPDRSLPVTRCPTRRQSKKSPLKSKRGTSTSRESQLISLGDKPYSCFECGKVFTCRSAFIRHERFHTGEKPYSCSQCGKCFSLSSHLNRHEKIHKGVKPYSCPLCGKCFSQKSNLDAHDRVHTGEKPYSCLECGKRFSTKVHLSAHERVHTGIKPYACSECGKYFTRKKSLFKHKSVHTGE